VSADSEGSRPDADTSVITPERLDALMKGIDEGLDDLMQRIRVLRADKDELEVQMALAVVTLCRISNLSGSSADLSQGTLQKLTEINSQAEAALRTVENRSRSHRESKGTKED